MGPIALVFGGVSFIVVGFLLDILEPGPSPGSDVFHGDDGPLGVGCALWAVRPRWCYLLGVGLFVAAIVRAVW